MTDTGAEQTTGNKSPEEGSADVRQKPRVPSKSGRKSNPRRRRTGHAEIDAVLPQVFDELDTDNADLVAEAVATVLRLGVEDTDRGDLKIVSGALREMRRAFSTFDDYRGIPKVSVYGSARTRPRHANYKQALGFANRMAEAGWMVITGGGPGIMAAANEGAGQDSGFGLVIRLPFEEGTNDNIANDDKRLVFRYFFARKLAFVKEADAFAFFPGGFGTMDEAFETLTLMQTGKSVIAPIVLLDSPGDDFWDRWDQFIRTQLLRDKLISEEDFALFKIFDDIAAAEHEITRFYRNYRSQRFVGDHLYLRMKQAPSDAELDSLNADFGDIVVEGRIERVKASKDERSDADSLDAERIRFVFNRKHYGRLRVLIDRLNELDGLPGD